MWRQPSAVPRKRRRAALGTVAALPIAHTVIYNNRGAAGLMVRTPLQHLCIVSGSVWLILHIGLRKG
jgi:hypothetical protein